MKIGFLGNANNYPFMLARAVRRAGHQVLFVLSQTNPLNRPEHRYDDAGAKSSDWILDAGELQSTERFQFLPPSPLLDQVVARLRECDALVLNHSSLALAPSIGRPHMALLTGTDIQDLADPGYARHADGYPVFQKLWLENAIACQRAGIASATGVSVFSRGLVPRYDAGLDGIGVREEQRVFSWMTDTDYLKAAEPPTNTRVRIFNAARLTWKSLGSGEVTADHKASDVMIRGLGMFAERHPAADFEIRLVDKGLQVNEARQLIEVCGLTSHVAWLKEMTQREVFEEYRQADIVFDQLGLSIVGMGGLDAMATGRPLIANARPEVMRHAFGEMPVCQASTVEEVAAQLERLVLDPAERARVGRASRGFVESHCSADGAARVFLERLSAVATDPARSSAWIEQNMRVREQLVEARESRLAQAEASLLEEAARATDLAEREKAVVRREGMLARRDLVSADLLGLQAQLAQERSELAKSFAAYDSLRIVRWQRALKAWKNRLSGRGDQT